jgi:hypothetical protein
MRTDKVLITTDQDGHTQTLNNVNHVIEVFSLLNDYLGENLDLTLTPDIAVDVLTNGGINTLHDYQVQQSKKLDKSGITGAVKSRMLKVIDEDLKTALVHFQRDLSRKGLNAYDPAAAMKYISFDSDGHAFLSDESAAAMEEQFRMYAEGPAQLELYNAHKKATDALNELRTVTRQHLPTINFVSPIAYFHTFFEMDAAEQITQKVINYKMF